MPSAAPTSAPAAPAAVEGAENDYEITIDAEPPPARPTTEMPTTSASASPTASQVHPLAPAAPAAPVAPGRPTSQPLPSPYAPAAPPPPEASPVLSSKTVPWGMGKPAAPAAPAAATPPVRPASVPSPAAPAPAPFAAPRPVAPPAPTPPVAPAAPATYVAPVPAMAPAATAAALQEVLAKLAARGPEYAALVEIARPLIEQVVWEVVPELAEMILRERVDKLGK
jgi:hypothetical protein